MSDAGWRNRLTVIITTSPLPRHPCSSMIEAILLSLREFGGLAGCRTVIVADGYDASAVEGQARWKKGKISEDSAARYEQHKQRVRAACEAGAPPFEQAELIEQVDRPLPTAHGPPPARPPPATHRRSNTADSLSACGAPCWRRARTLSSWCSTTGRCCGRCRWQRCSPRWATE